MSKGRKPIPDELKKLRGTDQPCRMSNTVEYAERITDIKMITSTSRLKLLPTKRAKDIFKQKANQLIALGILTVLDIEHLAVYANSLDVLFSCMESMRNEPTPKYNKNMELIGYVPDPSINMYRQMVEHVNRIGAEFGFTPISRQKINYQEEEKKNPFQLLKDSI